MRGTFSRRGGDGCEGQEGDEQQAGAVHAENPPGMLGRIGAAWRPADMIPAADPPATGPDKIPHQVGHNLHDKRPAPWTMDKVTTWEPSHHEMAVPLLATRPALTRRRGCRHGGPFVALQWPRSGRLGDMPGRASGGGRAARPRARPARCLPGRHGGRRAGDPDLRRGLGRPGHPRGVWQLPPGAGVQVG